MAKTAVGNPATGYGLKVLCNGWLHRRPMHRQTLRGYVWLLSFRRQELPI